MVVVVIIGILVAVAVPVFGTVTRNAANRAHEANMRTLAAAASMHIAEVGRPNGNVTFIGTPTPPPPVITGANPPTNALLRFVAVWPTVPVDAAWIRADNPAFPILGDGNADPNIAETYTVTVTPAGVITVNIVTAVATP